MVGLTDAIDASSIDKMIRLTRHNLSETPPITVSFGPVLYHPEAITLGMQPASALDSLADAVRDAAQRTVARPGDGEPTRWPPHVTVAYSTAVQAAGPIIAALGRETAW
jgi:2'-5' RNA ligase